MATPLIDLGLIDGDSFNADHVNEIERVINESSPAGQIIMYGGVTAPAGWLLLNGQVVPNAQTTYPALWAVAPAGWKSGASLNLPNMAQRFPFGQSTDAGTGNVSAPQITVVGDQADGLKFTFTAATPGTRPAADFDWVFPGAVTVDGVPAATKDNSKGPIVVVYSAVGAKTATLTVAAGAGPPAGGPYPVTVQAVSGPRTIGAIGGANSRVLAEINLPAHHHPLSGPTADTTETHQHGTGNSLGGFVTQQITAGGPNALQITPGTGAIIQTQNSTSSATLTHHHDLIGTTGNTGSGTDLDIVPSFLTVSFLIRCY